MFVLRVGPWGKWVGVNGNQGEKKGWRVVEMGEERGEMESNILSGIKKAISGKTQQSSSDYAFLAANSSIQFKFTTLLFNFQCSKLLSLIYFNSFLFVSSFSNNLLQTSITFISCTLPLTDNNQTLRSLRSKMNRSINSNNMATDCIEQAKRLQVKFKKSMNEVLSQIHRHFEEESLYITKYLQNLQVIAGQLSIKSSVHEEQQIEGRFLSNFEKIKNWEILQQKALDSLVNTSLHVRNSISNLFQPDAEIFKQQITLREFITKGRIEQDKAALFINKLTAIIGLGISKGQPLVYSPEEIFVKGPIESPSIRLGVPANLINHNHKYQAPEVYKGAKPSEKSCVFNLAYVWDEMLHGTTYFQNLDQLENHSQRYRVRSHTVDTFYRELLSQAMVKDPEKRIGFEDFSRALEDCINKTKNRVRK